MVKHRAKLKIIREMTKITDLEAVCLIGGGIIRIVMRGIKTFSNMHTKNLSKTGVYCYIKSKL